MLTIEDVVFSHGSIMVALLPGTNFGFVWHGGAYIDVIRKSAMGTYYHNGVWYQYTDRNINVWDYLTDRPTIEFGNVAEFVLTINDFLESE